MSKNSDRNTKKQPRAEARHLREQVAALSHQPLEAGGFWQSLVDAMPNPVFYKDIQGVYRGCNTAFARDVLGLPPEDILGHTARDFPQMVPSGMAEIYHARDVDLMQEPGAQSYAAAIRYADGSLRHVSFNQATVADAEGQIVGMVAVMQDITLLKHQADYYRLLADNVTDIVWTLSMDMKTEYVSPSVTRALGYAPEEARALPLTKILTADSLALTRQMIQEELAAEPEKGGVSRPRALTLDLIHKNGESIPFEMKCAFLRDTDGQPTGILAVGHDISRRQQVESKLAERARQLQTAAEISRAATSILSLEELLPTAVSLIREGFHLYYAGIFLVDEAREWAVLRAGTGAAGEKMLALDHRLKIGESSMIGWCVQHNDARIALDVGEDAVRFDNPHLPQTRSEMALPLVSGSEVIGAMTIQSTEPDAFSQEDIASLQTMADQLANAIRAAQLLEATEAARRRSEILYQAGRATTAFENLPDLLQAIAAGAAEALRADHVTTYALDVERQQILQQVKAGADATPLALVTFEALWDGLTGQALRERRTLMVPKSDPDEFCALSEFHEYGESLNCGSFIICPLIYMGEIQGSLAAINRPDRPDFTEEDVALLEALAGQTASAVYNARLFDQIQLRARRLEATTTVSNVVSSILDLDALLPRAVDVIREHFDLYYAGIFLINETREWAVLQAGTGEAGEKMLAQRHRLKIGGDSMIGTCVAQTEARIALDVGQEAKRFDNPHLPETRSEMALPLVSRGHVIGAMTIQSTVAAAFTEGDIAVLQAMANQLATAIENARLFEQANVALAETESLYLVTRTVGQAKSIEDVLIAVLEIAEFIVLDAIAIRVITAWDQAIHMPTTVDVYNLAARGIDREYDKTSEPLAQDIAELVRDPERFLTYVDAADPDAEIPEHARREMQQQGYRGALTTGLMARGQILGFITFISAESLAGISQRDVQIVARTVADQVAVALDNILLVEQAQSRATDLESALAETEVLYQATLNISQAQTEEDILRVAADVGDFIGMDGISVRVYTRWDERGQPLTLEAHGLARNGEAERVYHHIPEMDFDPALASWFDQDARQILLVRDIQTSPDPLPDSIRENLEKRGYRSMIAVPLVMRGQERGMMAFYGREVADIPRRYLDVLVRTITDQVAIALDSRALMRESERRATRLQTASEVSRAASSILDQETLLAEVVELIRERFDLYYVGIFLVDDSRRWAVLRAGTGEAGERMRTSGHRLEVAGDSMIGTCISSQEARIALDVGQEARHFNNPHLPETRSELALPLFARGEVIGAMSIQSVRVAAFYTVDVTVLQTMADQVANAIINARLFADAETRLDELQRLQRRYAVEVWDTYTEEQDVMGFTYDLNQIAPLGRDELLADVPPSVWGGQSHVTSAEGGDGASLLSPLEVRGEPVGVMQFDSPTAEHAWAETDLSLLDSVRDQISLALENRLLLDQSQRALRETREREAAVRFLQEIAAFLNATDDIVAAQDELLRQLQNFAPVASLALTRYNARDKTLHLLTTGDDEMDPEALELSMDSGPAWVVQQGRAYVDEDIRRAPRFAEDEHLIAEGTVARAILPMQLGARILGTLSVSSPEPGAFTESVMQILRQVAAQVASAVERASLLRQTQSALGESQTLYQATSALAEATTYDTVLRAIVDHTILAETACAEIDLFVTDPETGARHDWLETVASWCSDPALTEAEIGARNPVSEVPALRILGDESLLVIEDVLEDARFDADDQAYYTEQNTRALVVAQLLASGVQIGLLQVKFTEPYYPTEQDIRLYRTTSEQAAVVLSNRQLLRLSQERAEQLGAAVDLANLTTSILDRETLLQDSMNFFRERFDLYYAGIFLLDDAEQWAELRFGTGDSGEKLLRMGYRVQVGGHSLVGWCTANAESRVVLDVANDPMYFENPLLPDTKSVVAMPLVSRGRVIGAISIQSDRRFAFTQEDIATLQLMTNQLANVIESANLYESSQHSLAETTMLYRIAQRVADARTVEDVLRAAVEGISERAEPDVVLAGLLLPLGNPEALHITVSWDRDGREFPVSDYPLDKLRRLYDTLRTEYRFISPDATQDPLVDDFARNIYQQLGVRATAAFQLEVRGVQYGAMMIHSRKAREFSTSELRFYESVARQAFVALESLNLVQTTQEEAEQRAILNEVLQTASSALDPLVLMGDVSEVIARRMEMPVMMWRWDEQFILPVAAHDAGGVNVVNGEELPRFLLGQVPLAQRAINNRELAYVDLTLGREYALPYLPFKFQHHLEEALAMPLTVRDQVFGVLMFCRQEGHPAIDDQEREFIQSAAINISVALETARLYQDAQETAEKLKEVDRLKTQFMANMSHELRTPLNSIIGFSRVILKGIDGPLTEMQTTDLTAIHDSGKHLLALINDILDISKIEAGKMELMLEEVEIADLITSVMSTSMAFVKDKPVKLLTDVPEDVPTVLCDGRRVRQVLINLIGNAGKFTEEGFIKVGVTYDNYQVILSVQDTGIGIPQHRIAAVFEQFEQVDSTSTRRYGGTGLGVPLSKKFIELHNGDMWLESEVGEGTTFYFSLPIKGPAAQPEDDEGIAVERKTSGAAARTILAVDDDEGVITLFRRYLEKQGYRVFGLTNSERAVDEARRLKPYAITLDVIMPGKDGWAVIQELRQDPETRDIPVIVCSILGDSDKGLSMGVADYLVKPIMEQDILNALGRLEQPKENGHVLVVDDNADDRKLLYRILHNAGYNVKTAEGGAEAIAKIHAEPPNLVVLDLMMPEVDGFAVLENLKGNQVTRHIPVVVVTAKELEQQERQRLQQRVEALLEKGIFDQNQLLNDVTIALNRIREREEKEQAAGHTLPPASASPEAT